jgi:hypothetical protein
LIRQGRNAFTLRIEPPIAARPGTSHAAALRTLVTQCGHAIERFVRRFPDQWLGFDEAVRPADASGPHRRVVHEHEGSVLHRDSGR